MQSTFMMTNASEEINQIKNLIESRTKFISLSGLSGVVAGILALFGAYLANRIIYESQNVIYYDIMTLDFSPSVLRLITIAVLVFVGALTSAYLLSLQKAKQRGTLLWNAAAKRLVQAFLLPLFVGGVFVIFLILRHHLTLVAPACLLFYGLALVSASHFTYGDVKLLGYAEILLGMVNLFFVGQGLFFWSIGFGVFHIIYGIIMYYKYEKDSN